MKFRSLRIAILAVLICAPLAAQTPLRIFIRASKKTHGPGMHDYPAFLVEWKKLLTQRGAAVDGAERFPTAEELAKTDVLINFSDNGANVSPAERALLDPFLKRGGGAVTIHDALCGNDPDWYASVFGAAKKHGVHNWQAGMLKVHIEDRSHPIVAGAADFEMQDEMFYLLTLAPEMKVLATVPDPEGKPTPQLVSLEKTLPGGMPYRSVVVLQGHSYASFERREFRDLLVRSIAWAGKRPVDSLMPRE